MLLESRLLKALAPWRAAPALRVALSGGLDSTVLLHLLAGLARREALPALSAIHIDHGLQAFSAAWAVHCTQLCHSLGIELHVEAVQVPVTASLEEAARDARYAAFARHLRAGEVLLLAQHADDQVETLLFRLLRGAGVRGLAGMPVQRVLGQGMLLRPLLGVPRSELEGYARAHRLVWVEDPSNADCRFSRNMLRQQVLPLLEQRWPAARSSLLRSAQHLAEAQQLLDELAELDLRAAAPLSAGLQLPLPSLQLQALRGLSEARQRNALRVFLAPLTELPDARHWAGWCDLRDAGEAARPVWKLARGELRRAGDRLWWLSGTWLKPVSGVQVWGNPAQPLQLPGNGCLSFAGEIPQGPLSVRYRQGGEVLVLPGRGHRDLKRLLNEREVPAFVRERLPLLYRHDQLLAVANLPDSGVQSGLFWQPPCGDQGLS
jgi:tRNA(Ile)-lysidine synthase